MDGEGEGGGSEGIDIQDGGVRGDQLKLKRREERFEQVESEQRKRHKLCCYSNQTFYQHANQQTVQVEWG